MQYDFLSRLKKETDDEFELLARYKSELMGAPKTAGALKVNSVNGKPYYYTVTCDHYKRHTYYIGGQNHPLVQAIQQRRFFETVVANLESNIKEMKRLRDKYRPIDPNRLRETFPKAYQFDDPRCFELAGTVDEEAWKRAAYESSKSHPENLKHVAADGARVRSKSEVIITNILHAYGLTIRHEEERVFAGMPIAPDFIIYSNKLQREIVWEHFGMMSRPGYRREYVEKMTAFTEAGYYPYVNLITTFDDIDGNIDSQQIDRLAQEYFL